MLPADVNVNDDRLDLLKETLICNTQKYLQKANMGRKSRQLEVADIA